MSNTDIRDDNVDYVIDKLLPMWEEDCVFKNDLTEDLKVYTPSIRNKYTTMYYKVRRQRLIIEEALEEHETKRSLYFLGHDKDDKGNYFNLKITKGEMSVHLNADMTLMKMRQRLSRAKEAEKALEEILRQINGRPFEIRTMIQNEMFKAGMN